MPESFYYKHYNISLISTGRANLDAAKAVLDKIHGPLAHSRADKKIYTLGIMHVHNMVITCLPFGFMGRISSHLAIGTFKLFHTHLAVLS
jgi:hypothetical protein